MVSLPWFLPYKPRNQESAFLCSVGLHRASDELQRLRLPLSHRYLSYLENKELTEDRRIACSALPYGWLLLDDSRFQRDNDGFYEFTLMNPITGVQIELPYLGSLYTDFKAAISPPPRLDVFVLTSDKWCNRLHLSRQGDYSTDLWVSSDSGAFMEVASVIFYGGKFYCFRLDKDFTVFDVDCQEDRIEPRYLDMDQKLLPKDDQPWPDMIRDRLAIFLVESNGKMLLVCEIFEYDPDHTIRTLLRFELFEADLSNMKWVKAESLGDQALIIYKNFVVSLVAADVGVRQNCIYVLDPLTKEGEPTPWNMFDLSTGEMANALLPCPPSSTHLMFVPNIY